MELPLPSGARKTLPRNHSYLLFELLHLQGLALPTAGTFSQASLLEGARSGEGTVRILFTVCRPGLGLYRAGLQQGLARQMTEVLLNHSSLQDVSQNL